MKKRQEKNPDTFMQVDYLLDIRSDATSEVKRGRWMLSLPKV